jgi:hypothetical protein
MHIVIEAAMGYVSLGESTEYNKLFLKILDNQLIDRLYRRYVRRADIRDTEIALTEIIKITKNESDKVVGSFLPSI